MEYANVGIGLTKTHTYLTPPIVHYMDHIADALVQGRNTSSNKAGSYLVRILSKIITSVLIYINQGCRVISLVPKS